MFKTKKSRKFVAFFLAVSMIATMVFAIGASPTVQPTLDPIAASSGTSLMSPFIPNNVGNFDTTGFNGIVYNPAGRPTANPGWTSSASYGVAPFFYGVTSITAPTGSVVDIREAVFRTLASDVFDGDITHHIQRLMPANPVITTDTLIVYSITNSRGTTTLLDVQVTFEDRDDYLVSRVVHSMPNYDMFASSRTGDRRGSNTDQQQIGLYMPPNSSFDVRVTSRSTGAGGSSMNNMILYTYQAAWGQNRSTTLTGDAWHTISHGDGVTRGDRHIPRMGRVPVMVTPRNDNGHFEIELRFALEGEGSVRGLHFFNTQDANPDYGHFTITEAQWLDDFVFIPTDPADDYGRMFAIIQSPTYVMLVAYHDKHDLSVSAAPVTQGASSTRTGQGIQSILDNKDHMNHWFNHWYGLCINSSNPWDRLVHSRQFVVPAYGGAGAGFMAHRVLGLTVGSGNIHRGGGVGRYLRINTQVHGQPTMDFLAMHELGHRYDSNKRLGEVITNVFPNFMQEMHRGHHLTNHRWNNQSIAQRETQAFVNWPDTRNFNSHLVRVMYLFEATPCRYQAKQSINSVNREVTYRNLEWGLGSVYAYGIWRSSGVNIIPMIDAFDWVLDDHVRDFIMNSDARIANHMFPMINGATNGAAIMDGIVAATPQMYGPWSGTVLGAGATNLTATSTINIVSPDMTEILGKNLYIYDGPTRVWETIINGTTINVPALPVGSYRVVLPRIEDYTTMNVILHVTAAGDNQVDASYWIPVPVVVDPNLALARTGARPIGIEQSPVLNIANINNGHTDLMGGRWSPDMNRMRANVEGFTENPNIWFGIDFGAPTAFDEVVIYISGATLNNRMILGDFVVEVAGELEEHPHENNSLCYEDWTIVATGTAGDHNMVVSASFPVVTANFVRIRTTSLIPVGTNSTLPSITEIQVFREPCPEDCECPICVHVYDYTVNRNFGTWVNTTGSLTASVNADFTTFTQLTLNGTPIADANFSVEAGAGNGTVFTLPEAFLGTLAVGTHSITAYFGATPVSLTVTIPEPPGPVFSFAVIEDLGVWVNETGTLSALIDADFDTFTRLRIWDGSVVPMGGNFEVTGSAAGATITLSEQFLGTLPAGVIRFAVEFGEGNLAVITAVIPWDGAIAVVEDFGVWTGRTGSVSASINAPNTLFTRLLAADGTEISDANFNVTTMPGGFGTVITLSPTFLATFPAGTATFTAEFAGDETVGLQVTIPAIELTQDFGTWTHRAGTASATTTGTVSEFIRLLDANGDPVAPASFTITAGEGGVGSVITLTHAFLNTLPVGTVNFTAEFPSNSVELQVTVPGIEAIEDFGTWTDRTGTVSAIVTGRLIDFSRLLAADGTVVANTNFSLRLDGANVVIILNEAFLSTLPVGEVTFTAVFGANEVELTVVIPADGSDQGGGDQGGGDQGGGDQGGGDQGGGDQGGGDQGGGDQGGGDQGGGDQGGGDQGSGNQGGGDQGGNQGNNQTPTPPTGEGTAIIIGLSVIAIAVIGYTLMSKKRRVV